MPLQRADDAYDTSKFDGVQFPMTDLTAGGNRIIYVVSHEALRDRATADGDAPSDTVSTFLKHRPLIEKIASDKYDARIAERLVNTQDLTPIPVRPNPLSFSSNPGVSDYAAARRNAALLSTTGPIEPPFPLRASSSGQASGRAELELVPASVTIIPTPYPPDPGIPLVVHGFLQIDTRSAAFVEFGEKIDQLTEALTRSNEIAGNIRDQLLAEIKAGMSILAAPKPDPNLIKVLLEYPLLWIASAAGTGIIGGLAYEAVHLLYHLFSQGPAIAV